MVDLDLDLDVFGAIPFEAASNRAFTSLLLTGVVLLMTVAVLGRSPIMAGIVACYLLAIPGYVAYRIWVESGSKQQ